MSRLLVLGNAGYDLAFPAARLPLPGETLVADALLRAPGGKGVNQAVIAARAGADVHFCAPIGEDEQGRAVAAALAREPLAALRLLPYPGPTDTSVLMVARDGENAIICFCGNADALEEAEAARFAETAAPGDILLLQGNLSFAATQAAMARGRARGATIMLNPAPLRWEVPPLFPVCDILVANAVEAEIITGRHGAEAAAFLHEQGISLAIVTLGGEGCAVASAEGAFQSPARPVRVVDTTGAGDSFCGVLAAALLAGRDARAAVEVAQRAAALTVQRPGAFDALPGVDELRAVMGG